MQDFGSGKERERLGQRTGIWRPAELVTCGITEAAGAGGSTLDVFCQITSHVAKDTYAIELGRNDFEDGGLRQIGDIRPNRIFTAYTHIILKCNAGDVRFEKVHEVIDEILEILR